MNENQIKMLRFLIQQEIECAGIDGMEHGAWGWAEKQADENWKKFQESFTKMTDTQKLELLLNEIKSTAKRKTCYDSLGATGHYHYSDDHDATFDDGDRYGKIMFARELLERIGETYD